MSLLAFGLLKQKKKEIRDLGLQTISLWQILSKCSYTREILGIESLVSVQLLQ